MTAVQAAILSNVLASGALALTFFHLWRLDRQEIAPVFWGLAYLVNATRLTFLLLGWDRIAPVFVLLDLFSALVPALLLAGSFRFIRRPLSYRLLAAICLAVAASTSTMRGLELPQEVILAPQIAFIVVALFVTGVAFIRQGWAHPGVGYSAVGAVVIAWGLYVVAGQGVFALFGQVPWVRPAYFLGSALLLLAIALSLMFAFQRRQYLAGLAQKRELEESRQRFLDLVQISSDWIWEHDTERRITYISPNVYEATGVRPEEFIGRIARETLQVDEKGAGAREFLRCVEARLPFRNIRTRLGTPKGARTILMSGKPVFDSNGVFTGYRGVCSDVTDASRTKEALDAIMSAVAHSVGRDFFGVLVMHLCRTLGVDRAFVGRLGSDNRVRTVAFFGKGRIHDNIEYDLADTPCATTVRQDICVIESGVRQKFPQDEALVSLGVEGYAGTTLRDASGAPIGVVVLMHGQKLADAELVRVVLTAIAARAGAELERQIAETALNESEKRFRTLIDNMPLAFHLRDAGGRFLLVNKTLARWFSEEESFKAIGKTIGDLQDYLPEGVDFSTADAGHREVLAKQETQVSEYTVATAGGKNRTIVVTRFPVPDDKGNLTLVGSLATDVTELREMARLIETRAARRQGWLDALDLSRTGMIVEEADRTIAFANSTARELLGGGCGVASLFEQAGVGEELKQQGSWSGDIIHHRPGRADVVLHVSGARMQDGSTIAVLEDATGRIERDRRQSALERRMQESQKMEALGQLAGGIAHDFNNLIGAIQGFANFIAEDTDAGDSHHRFARQILGASKRARDLIQQILAFSRRENTPLLSVRLDELVREGVGLLKASLPASTTVRYRNQLPEAAVNGNATQLLQILINLGVNASDALGGRAGMVSVTIAGLAGESPLLARLRRSGATLSPDTADVEAGVDGGAVCYVGTLPAGRRYLRMSVRDRGVGIPADVLPKIFAPFYTTKASGRGTGLGLAVVHGLVVAHQGALVVSSTPGEGTEVSVILPMLEHDADRQTESVPDAVPVAGRPGRVLVVDDNRDFGDMVSTALDRAGHDVAVCDNPAEALTIFREAPHIWDALVTDHSMPEMTGVQLVSEIKRLRPGLPCLMCTGFASGTLDEGTARAAGVDGFFRKPVEIPELLKAVTEAIRDARAA